VCRICVQKIKKPTKLKYEYDFVKKFFEDRNCKLLSKSYVDAHEKLDYLCECGNKSKIAWHHFRQGSRCLNCAENKRRHTYEDVKNYIEEKGCKLLSKEYQNSTSQKLDIICCCGNTHSIRFSAFKQGARCPRCSVTSRGEKKIAQFLEVNGIKYKYQYVIKKCRNINPLPFDFAVLGNSGAIKCLIEFDGKQHFAPIDFFGGEESYHKVRNNDYIKNTYCQTNNLLLFRISYKDLENVDHILKEILVKNNCKFISKYQVNKPRLNEIGNRSIIESSYGNSYEINENTEGGTAS
jgi:hypothetical protein